MIDWQKTKETFGYSKECLTLYRPKIIVACDKCTTTADYTIRVKSKIVDDNLRWECPKCVGKRQEVKEKLSNSKKKAWNEGRAPKPPKMTDEIKQKISNGAKNFWENQGKLKEEYSKKYKKLYSDQNYKKERSEHSKQLWTNAEFVNSVISNYPHKLHVSSIQVTLYSILNDLEIKHYREYQDKPADKECTIGPYNFDCVIPRNGKPSLLIECQGDYWHSLDKAVKNDQSKASYIENNFTGQYELKCLWEHEFSCKDKVIELIKYWMGITQLELIDFDFKDVKIKKTEAKDYKLLLSKYHYLSNAGRGGITYGAYLGNELIGVCVFSPLIRQNINISGYEQEEVRELSRLCIHPRYQKHNFASWFVSRCIKQLDIKYKCIISYADTTFNHDGTIYKACNFIQDSVIKPDYWYIDKDGWVMHKKTLYERAVSLKMKEADFATKHKYTKVYGKEKLRFIYKR